MKMPGFFGGSVPAQSVRADQQRVVNFYPERLDAASSKSPLVFYPTPGVSAFATSTKSPVRALFAQASGCYAVIGDTLYTVSSAGALSDPETVAIVLGDTPASISGNGVAGGQLYVTSGGVGYSYATNTGTLATEHASGADQGVMVDGYFFSLNRTTSTVAASDLLDGTTWNGLSVTQRSMAPDPWQAMATVNRELWLLGSATSEVWYNAGTTPFPFEPQPGGLIPFGIAAPWSACAVADTLLWLAQTPAGGLVVVQVAGLTPRVVSTHALAYTLRQYETVADAVAWTYEMDGHAFYVLTFPTANATWVYDLTTGLWGERGTWNATTGAFDAWRPQYHAFQFGQHLVGDSDSGTIWTLDPTVTTDVDGEAIRRIRRAPVLNADGKRIFYSKFQLDLDVGLGLEEAPGDDPQVVLRYSDDSGRTWATAGAASAGKQGEYLTRVQWHRLGSSRDRVFEVECADVVPWRIVDAWLETHGGIR